MQLLFDALIDFLMTLSLPLLLLYSFLKYKDKSTGGKPSKGKKNKDDI